MNDDKIPCGDCERKFAPSPANVFSGEVLCNDCARTRAEWGG